MSPVCVYCKSAECGRVVINKLSCVLPHIKEPSGTKHDQGKDAWHLFPWDAARQVVRVLMFGADEYGPENWREVRPRSRYFDAAIRHLAAWRSGEKEDAKSTLPHLAHAACCVLFLIVLDHNKVSDPTKD